MLGGSVHHTNKDPGRVAMLGKMGRGPSQYFFFSPLTS